jgi:uncharacterized phage protein gp47/JayE
MQTLDQLLAPKTASEYRAQLLAALQGVGYVSKTGSGSGSAVSSGVATNGYSVRVKVSTAGELGTAAFQVSTDGGTSYGAAVTMPSSGTYAVPGTGLTLQFANGTAGRSFEVGDTFSVELTVPTFPATSWQVGSAPLTIIEKDAEANEHRDALLSDIAGGGFLSTATGDWLTLYAFEVYGLSRLLATATVGTLTLTNSTGSPIAISVGQLWVGTLTGLRFNNTTGGSVPAGGTLSVTVRAEGAGAAYNVSQNGITTLFTSVPGLSVNNPLASWITTAGADEESDESLRERCRARWPQLSDAGGTDAVYAAWAKAGSSGAVTRVLVRRSLTVPGEVEVYLAGPTGPASSAVAAVQSYLNARVPYPSTVLVAAAVAQAYTITAEIFAYAGFGAAALAHATRLIQALDAAQPIGSADVAASTIYLTNIIEALSTPVGVRNVVVTLPAADVVLDPTEVPVLTLNLTVTEV